MQPEFLLYSVLCFLALRLWEWAQIGHIELLLSAVRNTDIKVLKYKKERVIMTALLSFVIPTGIAHPADWKFALLLGLGVFYCSLFYAGSEEVDT